MALAKCKECEKEVSTSAKTCPHCGVKYPGVTDVSTTSIFVGTFAIGIILFLISQCSTGDKESEKATCKLDLKCWGGNNLIDATVDCKKYVEKLSLYSARWTGDTTDRFSHFRWLNKEKATLTFVGDKIEFQNGFGAYQAHVYECDYDPTSKTVLDVHARPGRL